MAKPGTWLQAHRPTTRRLVQLYCALLYNAHLKGFITGQIYTGPLKAACVPGLNCYSCPAAAGACPLGALQNAVTSAGTRAGTYILGILLLYGVMLGRTICGWLCPAGLIQELLYKIPTPKLRKSRLTRALSYLRYVILAVFVLAIPLAYGLKNNAPLPAFCKYICPAGTLEGAAGLLSSPENAGLFGMLGVLFTNKFVIMLAVGLACVFCFRAFCRFLCPLGAIYGLFNRIAVVGIRVDAAGCTRCGGCVRRCPMDVRRVGDRACISCGRCMEACPAGAISLKAGRFTLQGPALPAAETKASGQADGEKRRRRNSRIARAAALAVLAAVIICCCVMPQGENPAAPVTEDTGSVPVGHAAGERLESFAADLLGGGTFRLEETRGHAVFINLWATYCAPCVQELAYFERLQSEHPEITVLAVHASLTNEDVAAYVAGRGWDHLRFCVDTEDDRIFGIAGGSPVLPQTIVLNARGEVVYNEIGSVTFEQLEALLEKAQ